MVDDHLVTQALPPDASSVGSKFGDEELLDAGYTAEVIAGLPAASDARAIPALERQGTNEHQAPRHQAKPV